MERIYERRANILEVSTDALEIPEQQDQPEMDSFDLTRFAIEILATEDLSQSVVTELRDLRIEVHGLFGFLFGPLCDGFVGQLEHLGDELVKLVEGLLIVAEYHGLTEHFAELADVLRVVADPFEVDNDRCQLESPQQLASATKGQVLEDLFSNLALLLVELLIHRMDTGQRGIVRLMSQRGNDQLVHLPTQDQHTSAIEPGFVEERF